MIGGSSDCGICRLRWRTEIDDPLVPARHELFHVVHVAHRPRHRWRHGRGDGVSRLGRVARPAANHGPGRPLLRRRGIAARRAAIQSAQQLVGLLLIDDQLAIDLLAVELGLNLLSAAGRGRPSLRSAAPRLAGRFPTDWPTAPTSPSVELRHLRTRSNSIFRLSVTNSGLLDICVAHFVDDRAHFGLQRSVAARADPDPPRRAVRHRRRPRAYRALRCRRLAATRTSSPAAACPNLPAVRRRGNRAGLGVGGIGFERFFGQARASLASPEASATPPQTIQSLGVLDVHPPHFVQELRSERRHRHAAVALHSVTSGAKNAKSVFESDGLSCQSNWALCPSASAVILIVVGSVRCPLPTRIVSRS